MGSRNRRKGPESVRTQEGSSVEAWLFWPDSPAHRCRWPTAALVARLLSGEEPDPSGHATRAVLLAYQHLLADPVGTEAAVRRLRALRRAERAERTGGHNAQ